jgi:hypothetical protein
VLYHLGAAPPAPVDQYDEERNLYREKPGRHDQTVINGTN